MGRLSTTECTYLPTYLPTSQLLKYRPILGSEGSKGDYIQRTEATSTNMDLRQRKQQSRSEVCSTKQKCKWHLHQEMPLIQRPFQRFPTGVLKFPT